MSDNLTPGHKGTRVLKTMFIAWVATACSVLMSCDLLYADLGSHPADDIDIDEDHPLKHVLDALGPDISAETAGELLAVSEQDLTFHAAPDPSELLRRTHQEHQALPPLSDNTLSLRVLVQNVGLLQRAYIEGTVEVPQTSARREVFAEVLLQGGWDVMLLSEVWEQADVLRLTEAAEALDYLVYGGSEQLHPQTGVVVVVRNTLIDGEAELSEQQFFAQYQLEQFPGPNLRRGFVQVSFLLAGTNRRVHLLSTHFTSFIDRSAIRSSQARELGLYVRDEIPADDLVLVGGDFNAAPFYPRDVWMDGHGEPHAGWWANTIMYPALLHYGQLVDAHAASMLSNEVDLWLNEQIPPDGTPALLEEPMGDASACDRLVPGFFTAIDCNSLHFESYAGTEYPQRLDYLFYRDPGARLRVTDASLAYDELLDIAGEAMELSDHYGVGFSLQVAAD